MSTSTANREYDASQLSPMTDSQRQTSVPETAQAKSQQQQGKSQRSSSSVSADATLPLPAIPVDPSLSPGNGAGPGSWTSKDAQQQAAAKQSLKQWWGKFTKQQQLAQAQAQNGLKSDTSPTSSTSSGPNGIPGKNVFGVPLSDSLKYAGVAISMLGADEVKQVYGYGHPVLNTKFSQARPPLTSFLQLHPNSSGQMWPISQTEGYA